MKKPAYVEPVIGWNEDDFNTGLQKFAKYYALLPQQCIVYLSQLVLLSSSLMKIGWR